MFFFCSEERLAGREAKEDEVTRIDKIAFAAAALAAASVAAAAETLSFSYDARGRLIRVAHNGSVNNNVATNYGYDKADNRILKKTAGVP